MRMQPMRLVLMLVLSVLVGRAALGQMVTATLNGVVSDSAGAAIPKAQIQIQNVNTGMKMVSETDNAGLYSIAQLPSGSYALTVTRTGFRKSVQTGIVLTIGQIATLNVALQVGDVKETVTVTADAELINVTTADLSAVVNQAAVEELPLNGRDPSSLVLLTTGTTNVLNTGGGWMQSSNAFPDETGASSGGGRQGSTYYLLDGAPNMDPYLELAAPFPNSDATQEFRVISTNFDAQYGFSPNAVVTVQTRSGTNTLHGGVFEFIRNNDLNAANFFSHAIDTLKRNQFGGYLGGAARRDKLFFFVNYQGTRATQAAATNSTYTPTSAMLSGDFSAVKTSLGMAFNQTGMSYNTINPSRFNSAALTIAKTALPLGDDAATGLTNYVGPAAKYPYDEGTARIDYVVNARQRLFLRSFVQYYEQKGGNVKGNLLALADDEPGEYYNEVLNHNWTVSDSLVNNLNLFYSQMSIKDSQMALDSSGNAVCWSRYINVSEIPNHCYLEGLTVNNGFSSNWDEPVAERRSTWGLSDQIIKTMKKHTLSAGVDVHKQFAQENTDYPTTPIITFDGAYTGFGLADFLMGYVSTYEQGAGEIASVKGWQFGFFAQDQYRVAPNLTLTVGLRWDPNFPPASTGGRGAALHPGQQSLKYPNAPLGVVFPGDDGVDDALMPTSYRYFQPRIGLSYQPSRLPHTALRAGFGMFTGPLPYANYNHVSDLAPFSPTFLINGSTTTPVDLSNPWSSFAGGNQFASNNWASLTHRPASSSAFQTPMDLPAIFSNNFRLGMTQSWSISIEQQLTPNTAMHVAYIGSQSYHQAVIVDQNPGHNNVRTKYGDTSTIAARNLLGQVLADVSSGTSPYHSLQIGFDKHMSHHFQVQSNFTWSKVLDSASNGNISNGGSYPGITNPYDGQLKYNKGISDMNVPFISVTNFIYTTPALQGWNPVLKHVLGSWEISSIYTLQSGRPFGISGGNGNNNSGALQYHDRADVVPGVAPQAHTGNRSNWLKHYVNAAAYTQNATGTFGNSGRNIFKAPYVNTADSAIIKNWRVQDRYGVQFRWEFFNTFNHVSFGTPNADISSGSFGQITSVGPIAPRVMQGGLKVNF